MLIYLDDFIFHLQSVGGISVYWKSVISEMSKSKAIDFKVLTNKINPCSVKEISSKQLSEYRYPFFLSRILLKKLQPKSIFHSSYLRISLQKNIANVVTIHDLAAEMGHVKGIRAAVKKWLQKIAIKRADGIICVSEETKKNLLIYYPDAFSKKICVIHHGCSDTLFPLEGIQKVNNKIIFVGRRSHYKNFQICIDIIEKLPQYNLVVISNEKFYKTEWKTYKSKFGNRIQHFENISTDELNYHYNTAHCLIYPSKYEGFGLPVLEAMKTGCPVVCSDIPCLREIAEDGAIFIRDYENPDAFVNEILSLNHLQKRTEMIKKGIKRARKFSWANHLISMTQFYSIVHHSKFGESASNY
ncbi:glycosyltransferase family 4 protein [Nubsella zeaxanthinifaciens]|uniref:glycosyltransferase family 4 protein n=1 Tax=Nubsella zeaxanthinifaciens TaxID=392412 RepID=UPI003CFDC973